METLKSLYERLQIMAKSYILHRFHVAIDYSFWLVFRSLCKHPFLHLDYSENIAMQPKYEAQSAHFSRC